jgi:lysophospholipase L1-like esterase
MGDEIDWSSDTGWDTNAQSELNNYMTSQGYEEVQPFQNVSTTGDTTSGNMYGSSMFSGSDLAKLFKDSPLLQTLGAAGMGKLADKLFDVQKGPGGYRGGIPTLTASRQQLPIPTSMMNAAGVPMLDAKGVPIPRRPGSGGITYFSPMQYTPVTAPPATTTPVETVQAAGGGMMYSSGGALRYNGEDGSVVGATDTPNYEQLVRDAYATVGRTGVGEGAAQIDQGGLDFWTNALSSGALSAADLNNQFGAAVNAYIAEKPEDKYTQQIQNYRADQLANTNANATTGGVADLITTGNMGSATTGGIADLTGAMTNANTGAATMGDAASTGAATMGNAATMSAATPALNNYNIDAFGDSTTYGYNAGNQLTDNMVTSAQSALGEGYSVNNMGVNSTTVGDLLTGANGTGNNWANSLANDSGVVVLNYGLNEASRGESLESFRNNLTKAINQAKAAGKQVVLQTPNVVGSSIGYGGNVEAYADVIRDVASSTGSALDDKFAFTSGRKDVFDTSTNDDLHPGGSMYTTLGGNLANTILGLNNTGSTTSAAKGGLMGYAGGGIANLGGYSDGGRLLKGPGDGVSDSIPAMIGKRQPARLADGEFVIPARIVSELGNGSTEAGARKLYAMMDRIKKARSKAKNIAADTKSDKHLPA